MCGDDIGFFWLICRVYVLYKIRDDYFCFKKRKEKNDGLYLRLECNKCEWNALYVWPTKYLIDEIDSKIDLIVSDHIRKYFNKISWTLQRLSCLCAFVGQRILICRIEQVASSIPSNKKWKKQTYFNVHYSMCALGNHRISIIRDSMETETSMETNIRRKIHKE